MATTTVILGLAGGFVVLYYLLSTDAKSVPSGAKKVAATRNVNWVYGDYLANINNPLHTKNRFVDQSQVTETVTGTNGQALMSVSHGHETFQLYRIPTRW